MINYNLIEYEKLVYIINILDKELDLTNFNTFYNVWTFFI